MINFASCFTVDKAHGCGAFPNWGVQTWLLPHPRPLILRMPPPTLGLYSTHKYVLMVIKFGGLAKLTPNDELNVEEAHQILQVLGYFV